MEAEPGARRRPVFKRTNQVARLHVGANVLLHEKAEPDVFQYRGACEACLVQGEKSSRFQAGYVERPVSGQNP